MKYIVYLTTNKINNKIYIGVHKTENPDKFDGYLGCGAYINKPSSYQNNTTPFLSAVMKYGPSKFVRKTLKVFDNLQDALDLERWLVDEEFIARTDTYNITIGGGIPPLAIKPVYQYNLDETFVKRWESIIDVTNFYKINKDRVRMVINDKRSLAGFYWSEINYSKLNLKEYRPSSRGSIRQYTTDGIFLKSFKNTTEASKALDIPRTKITNAIYGKYATSGYWFLKEDETIEQYLDGSIKKEPKIYVYDITGSYIKEFENISSVKKELKYNKNDIKRAIKNNSLFQNMYWSTFKYTNILKENSEMSKPINKKIYQYDLQGNLIKTWDSITSCQKLYPSALQVCLGNRTHCHNFKFSFDKLMIQSDTIRNNG